MSASDREKRLLEEVELHLELETEANIRRGMSPDDARRAAAIAFGAAEHFKDEARDQFRSAMVASLTQDAHYAARTARRAPIAAAAAILTLSVAVALATLAFTAVNAVFVRALPYPEPDRLALVWSTQRGKPGLDPASFTNAMDWRRAMTSVQSLATFACWPPPILSSGGPPTRLPMLGVSSDFFQVLLTTPFLGRLFQRTDFAPGAAPTVVLTHALWRDRFGADQSIVNRRIVLDGQSVSVIGVLPERWTPLPVRLGCRPALYRPLDMQYDDTQRAWTFLKVIARLAPGASLQRAQAQLDVETARLATAYPEPNHDRRAVIVSMRAFLTDPLRPVVAFAQAGAVLVLLIACVNVVGLLVARATARRREWSIRLALGASVRRLARQMATECLLLGGLSGAMGVVIAAAGAVVVRRIWGDALPDPRGLVVDWRVGAFAVGASLAVSVALGMATIGFWKGDRTWMLASLRDGGRSVTGRQFRTRRSIVAVQFTLALIVLIAASLLLRSYRRLSAIDPGLDSRGVLTARVALPDASYPSLERRRLFFRQVIDRLGALGAVVAVGATSVLPESGNYDHTNARLPGRTNSPGGEVIPDLYRVTPGYFPALRIPLRAGRLFTNLDDDGHPPVAVLNETMAHALFPGENAVGRRLWSGAGQIERTVIGVVGDVYQYGLDRDRTMQLYVPHAQVSTGDLTLVVRAKGGIDAATLAPIVREAVRSTDPGIPLDDVLTMHQVLETSAARRRVLAKLSLALALGAIALAAIGLYGVISYTVLQRTPEIGIRIALGASAAAVIAPIVGDAAAVAIIGLVPGILAAGALVRFMAPLLFGISVADAVSFTIAPLVLIAVALLASVAPAVRAARLDVGSVLRGE